MRFWRALAMPPPKYVARGPCSCMLKFGKKGRQLTPSYTSILLYHNTGLICFGTEPSNSMSCQWLCRAIIILVNVSKLRWQQQRSPVD